MQDEGNKDNSSIRPLEAGLIGDGFGHEDEFIVGPPGNRINVMVDEDGIALFHVKLSGVPGIASEEYIVLTKSMFMEISRRLLGRLQTVQSGREECR
jgi:hypothetical protein